MVKIASWMGSERFNISKSLVKLVYLGVKDIRAVANKQASSLRHLDVWSPPSS